MIYPIVHVFHHFRVLIFIDIRASTCIFIPAGTQRCINVIIWLNIGHDLVQPYFNVDKTSKLQRWITLDISTWNQRCNMLEASTLKIGRHLDVESKLKYGRYLNIDDGWTMVLSFMFSSFWNNDCVLFISISTFYLLDNHNAYMQLNQRLHSRWTDAIIHGCALCRL